MNKTNELSVTKVTFAMFRRDCLHYFHKPSQIFNPLLFFFMVSTTMKEVDLKVSVRAAEATELGKLEKTLIVE